MHLGIASGWHEAFLILEFTVEATLERLGSFCVSDPMPLCAGVDGDDRIVCEISVFCLCGKDISVFWPPSKRRYKEMDRGAVVVFCLFFDLPLFLFRIEIDVVASALLWFSLSSDAARENRV